MLLLRVLSLSMIRELSHRLAALGLHSSLAVTRVAAQD